MNKTAIAGARKSLLISFVVLGLVTAAVFLPGRFTSQAGSLKTGNGLFVQTVSHDDALPNYDIRTDKTASDRISGFRQTSGRSAVAVADVREQFVAGEDGLRGRVPTLKVEYNPDSRTPEVIAPDVKQGRASLTSATGEKRSDVLRNFLKENTNLVGVNEQQLDSLKLFADYTNPDGDLSFVEFDQEINGIPVFRGEVKAGFSKNGEMFRVINNLAPGLDYSSLSDSFGDPMAAAATAARSIDQELRGSLNVDGAKSTDKEVVFGKDDIVASAEKMYFPTEPGVAVPAWRVLVYGSVGAYYVIVDGDTGTMLWRKNLTEDQSQSATYSVYVNPNAMMNVADSPFPITPGPVSPTPAMQGASLGKTTISLIGNEAPYTFNNLGWITDGNNTTDGNNVQSALDRKLPNTGSPANPNDSDPDGMATGSPSRSFIFTNTPGDPNTNTGDSPLPAGQTPTGCLAQADASLPTDFQKAAVSNLFYITNRYHDELYTLGFTEAARNFQNDNFGRGGVAGDRVAAQAQDCSGTNNANFTTPADGNRPTMQMYLWTGPNPDFDGAFDADVIVHEYTHGVSNRLHGNSSGLTSNMSRGMGEGWGDFYGHTILSQASDPINGVYTTGAYDTYLGTTGFTSNAYYGIRRFPKAVIAFTGGPNNRPHNPLTFADVDSTQFNITDGAFARGPFGSSTVDQVHNLGEIWSSTLWEVRAKLIARSGWAVGNRKVLQLVTDGMKLAPIGPTMLQERDAILSAAQMSAVAPEAAADVADTWAGFAARGMGFSAVVLNAGTGASNTRVTEAFDLPNLYQSPAATVTDTAPGGDGDGYPEPGETVGVTIPLTNSTGTTATGVTLQIVGGGSADYGSIASGTTVSRTINYTIPANTPCGTVLTLTLNVNSSLGATSFTTVVAVGQPVQTFAENFDGVTAPAFPAGWTATPVQNGINFVTTTTGPDTVPNAAFAADPTTVGGGSDLVSPSIPITSGAATVSFSNKYDTEPGWDGGVLDISINGGSFNDIVTAGGRFIQNGYNGILGAGANNPVANRNAWSGNSGGFVTTIAQLPPSAAGQNVQLRWRFGGDDNTAATGWTVDTIKVFGGSACSFTPPSGHKRADFDGDGKSDLSVFRGSDTNWYIQKSSGGISVTAWGAAGDIPTPGDFDGDGKTDLAVFRPSAGSPNNFVLNSNGNVITTFAWGQSGDVPVTADYDGDGKADAAVFRASDSNWYIRKSTGGLQVSAWGVAGDIATPGDYNGDGKSDYAIYRPSNNNWYILNSAGGISQVAWGAAGDKTVAADYDGDGKDDIAVFRASAGLWYIVKSSGGIQTISWGQSGDVAVPGDYDGDGKYDAAIFRSGTWWISKSGGGITSTAWGTGSDIAIPSRYVP